MNSIPGSSNFPHALPKGSILNGRYTVESVLGQGGFGITYTAEDCATKGRVAVKEFFPEEFASRMSGNGAVVPFQGESREYFEYGKAKFREEAKILSHFSDNPHIVKVFSCFEENGTIYLVMEYISGVGLNRYMNANGGRLTVKQANELLFPVMEALSSIHEKGLIHRDIAPDNILITDSGLAKLIDFGAARYSMGERSRSLDVVLKHGFAPKEQYARHGRQGPFSDVYSLAATYYYAITGRVPQDAIERAEEDDLAYPSTYGADISRQTEDALMKALSVQAADRFQTMDEFRLAMAGHQIRPASAPVPAPERIPPTTRPTGQIRPEPVKKQSSGKAASGIALALIIFFLLAAVVCFLLARSEKKRTEAEETFPVPTTSAEPSATPEPPVLPTAPAEPEPTPVSVAVYAVTPPENPITNYGTKLRRSIDTNRDPSVDEILEIIKETYIYRKDTAGNYRIGHRSAMNTRNSTGYILSFYYADDMVYYSEVRNPSNKSEIWVKLYFWGDEIVACRDYRGGDTGNIYCDDPAFVPYAEEFRNVIWIGMDYMF